MKGPMPAGLTLWQSVRLDRRVAWERSTLTRQLPLSDWGLILHDVESGPRCHLPN